MNKIKSICKWLACNFVENFAVESDSFIICGYSMASGLAVIATYNEEGWPVPSLYSFGDDWDDETIENCDFLPMEVLPFPLSHTVDNAFKLFSISLSPENAMCALWLGGANYGVNSFEIDDYNNVVLCEGDK